MPINERTKLTTPFPVSLSSIQEASSLIGDVVVRTPTLENQDINTLLGCRLLLKAENMQRTGAFKIRGAYNRMLDLTPEERELGAVTYSSGNHALGLAQAAQMLGSSAIIVMPSDAPSAKMKAVRGMGAEIVTYDRDAQNSADVVQDIIRKTGRIEVPPSAHPKVLAGAGTAALELLEDANGHIDEVFVPCGGGGITAATAALMHEASPKTRVFAAEPALFNDTQRSLTAGQRLHNPTGIRTICDAIMTPTPGELTFSINSQLLAGGLTATDDEVRHAMRFTFTHFKIVTEPGAVVGLAAILSGKIDVKDKTVATIITGGNIDLARFNELTKE